MRSAVIDGREELVEELAQKIYQQSARMFVPRWPWVFVRVLAKQQITAGGIWTPEHEQNKVTHEGIVLATWKPHERHTKGGALVEIRSTLQPGQHVLFPHWSGLPVSGHSEKFYRIVKEEGWQKDKEGGIFATVEEQRHRPEDILEDLMAEMLIDTGFANLREVVSRIADRFILVDKEAQSVTLSGR